MNNKGHDVESIIIRQIPEDEANPNFDLGLRLARQLADKGVLDDDLDGLIDHYAKMLACRDGLFFDNLFREEDGLNEFWTELFALNPDLKAADAYGRLEQPGIDLVTGFHDGLRRHRESMDAMK